MDIAVSADGSRIYTGALDGTTRIWDAKTGAMVAMGQEPDQVMCLTLTPGGDRIVTGSFGNIARILDAGTGQEIAVLSGHQGILTKVAVSPDGSRIITGSSDGTAGIWNAATNALIRRCRHNGHSDPVECVAVRPA